MQLNSIEIKGFKSFADNTVIHFNDKVTGVVGPNGSGKSNIVDAIRWVLGEQKPTELRLERMTDVIFNGSKKRKPGGVAQVSLSFDNTKNLLGTEYQQVTISRLLYRSGESEYRINGTACRLRDIQSLFLDTGIGSNSYAIIALGMVDEILQDKDHSRRRMFEQAAGVTKYKQRKHETLLKLKATSEDLERINDILFEIENNLKSLEKQAARAEKYLDLKARYKKLSLELAYQETQDIYAKNAVLIKNQDLEMDRLRKTETKYILAETDIEIRKKAILDEEQSLSVYQKELNALIHHLQEHENTKKIYNQKLEFYSQNKHKLGQQKEEWMDRLAIYDQEIITKSIVLDELKLIALELSDSLVQMENERNAIEGQHGEVKSSFDNLQKEHQDIERVLFEQEKLLAVNQNRIEHFLQSIDRVTDENFHREDLIVQLTKELEKLQTSIGEIGESLKIQEEKELTRSNQLAEILKNLDQVKQHKAAIERKLDAKRNELQLLRSMVDNLEGYPDSIRFLHKNWKEDLPLLADLLYAPEEYRATLEHFLEPYLSHYIVHSYAEAAYAIQLLSDAQKGKANFFILDAIKPVAIPGQQIEGLIPALDLLKFDQVYGDLFRLLFHNVFIDPQELNPAKFEIYDTAHITVLSASGKFVKKQFTLSGGSVGLFEGKKLGRLKNLEILEEELAVLENELAIVLQQLKAEETKQKQIDHQGYLQQIDSQKFLLDQKLKEEIQLRTRHENLNELKNQALQATHQYEDSIAQIESLNLEIKEEIQQRKSALKELLDNMIHIDSNYQEVAQTLSQAHENFNSRQIDSIRHQSKIENLVQDLEFQFGRKNEATSQIDKILQTQFQEEDQYTQITADLDALNLYLVDLYEKKQNKESGLNAFEQEYYNKRNHLHQLEQNLRELQREYTNSQTLINGLKDQIKDLEYRMETVKERLRIEFHVDDLPPHEEIEDESSDDLEGEEFSQPSKFELIKEKVRRLRDRIDNYGEINPMAVEAYREMKERYDTIFNQRQDILNAKESLLSTIQEIDVSATAQFLDAFTKVREHFIRVFRSLFTEEDSCDLLLLNPEQPLESDIDIIAKPKGKLPKTLSQLSGGEKTLTATALLFSLYLLKPAPFCIFDEVDAPLDDSNIEKFNHIIRDFSGESQFIIVTHNKQTMAAVDVIYGVFMDEPGVSKVSSVDFRDFEHLSILETSSN